MWIGMSGMGGGERGQSVGWEGERVGIDRGSWVGGERKGIDRGIGGGEREWGYTGGGVGVEGGESGDRQGEWGGRGREWG